MRRWRSCMRTASPTLPLDQKLLIWHLYQAALAGRDIYYDQRYAHNLEMRDVLEEILTHPAGVDPQTLAEIQRYTKLFWLNTGPYNNLTARKFVLKCTPDAFAAPQPRPQKAGAKFPLKNGETLEALLKRMQPLFFDPTSIRSSPTRRPARARTSCRRAPTTSTSASTMKDLEGFKERYALNSRVVKRRRQAGRGGLQDRRPLRQGDPAHRPASRGGDSLRDRRWRRRSTR